MTAIFSGPVRCMEMIKGKMCTAVVTVILAISGGGKMVGKTSTLFNFLTLFLHLNLYLPSSKHKPLPKLYGIGNWLMHLKRRNAVPKIRKDLFLNLRVIPCNLGSYFIIFRMNKIIPPD